MVAIGIDVDIRTTNGKERDDLQDKENCKQRSRWENPHNRDNDGQDKHANDDVFNNFFHDFFVFDCYHSGILQDDGAGDGVAAAAQSLPTEPCGRGGVGFAVASGAQKSSSHLRWLR